MRTRIPLRLVLLLSLVSLTFGCPDGELADSGGSGDEPTGPVVYEIAFDPGTATAQITSACNSFGPARFSTTTTAAVDGVDTRMVDTLGQIVMSSGSDLLLGHNRLRAEEGTEICLSSSDSEVSNDHPGQPSWSRAMSEDSACDLLESDSDVLSFELTMEYSFGSSCTLTVAHTARVVGRVFDGEVFQATSVSSTSQFGPATAAERTIDGGGLHLADEFEDRLHANSKDAFEMWVTGSVDGGLGGPTGSPPVVDGQEVVFDLGAATDLQGAYIWNRNQFGSTQGGVDEFEILVSTSDSGPFTSLGSFELEEACGWCLEPAQWIPFEADGVRRVKFSIDSAHSGEAITYVGLSETAFHVID